MMTIREAIAFLQRQDPDGILVIDNEVDGPVPADALAGPGDPPRREVRQIVVEESPDGEQPTIVIFE